MIGRAISSNTSGGTGAGPGVNKYFFICGIFDFSNFHFSQRRARFAVAAKKKAGARACGSPDPDASRLCRVPVLITWDNGAGRQSQGCRRLATISSRHCYGFARCNGVEAIVKGDHAPMPIECEIRDGSLVWIKSPISGVISYVVDVRGKSFAFTLGGRENADPDAGHLNPESILHATEACPFCPGNEAMTTREVFRMTREEVPEWTGATTVDGEGWVVRVINNLFPRIPAELTGNRNESYIVVEDPRHFIDTPRSQDDLIFTGALGGGHFLRLMQADARVMRLALENPDVGSIVIRKNQGRESGASQPHLHQQIIGSPEPFPAVLAEARAERENPHMWHELVGLMERLKLVIDRGESVVSYASPVGIFPRSYDVVMPDFRGLLSELTPEQMRQFANAIYRILMILGPLPLDYEIHQGEGLPLHAHINARLYPYSNVAGTLNLPGTLLQSAAAIRNALSRH
jgi:galactose-1-phosphate uridylyltransferase